MRICIDEDCPGCGYPERAYDLDREVFVCSSLSPQSCDYESEYRDA